MSGEAAVDEMVVNDQIGPAIVPKESNYLMNPVHPAFKQIRVGKPEPFSFDRRMWRR